MTTFIRNVWSTSRVLRLVTAKRAAKVSEDRVWESTKAINHVYTCIANHFVRKFIGLRNEIFGLPTTMNNMQKSTPWVVIGLWVCLNPVELKNVFFHSPSRGRRKRIPRLKKCWKCQKVRKVAANILRTFSSSQRCPFASGSLAFYRP